MAIRREPIKYHDGWYWIQFFHTEGDRKFAGAQVIAHYSHYTELWQPTGSSEPYNPACFTVIKAIAEPCKYCAGEGYAVSYLEKPDGTRAKLVNMNFPCAHCNGSGEEPLSP